MSQSLTPEKNRVVLTAVGILATFMIPQATFIVMPAVSSLAEYYTDIPYSNVLMLHTIVCFMIVPFSILSGAITGVYFRYKTVACFSAALIIFGGLFPYFVQDNFWMVLTGRAICGMGQGLAFPIGSAMIIQCFGGKSRNIVQGISVFVLNIAGSIYQSISGMLCLYDVHLIWLIHGCLFLPLTLMLIFMKEPQKSPAQREDASAGDHLPVDEKSKYSKRATFMTLMFGILWAPCNSVLLNMSQFIEFTGLGTSMTAGVVASCYTISGLAAGFTYPVLLRFLKKKMTPILMTFAAVGIAVIYLAQNVFMLMLGEFLIGFFVFQFWPLTLRDYAIMVNSQGVMFYSGLFAATWNLGTVLAGYWISGVYAVIGEENPVTAAGASIVFMLLIMIPWIIIRMKRPAHLEPRYHE